MALVRGVEERGLAVLVQARGIDIDRLHAALGLDAEHVVTGGLRLARGNRQLLPENMVEQGRLADVRPAHQGNYGNHQALHLS